MPGLKLVLPLRFTDKTLPILREDPLLPGSGALLLLDPTHPKTKWGSGVPAADSRVPNLAADQASALLGAGAEIGARMHHPAAFTGSAGKMERTTKGGLHGIVPQSGTAVHQSGPTLEFDTSLIAYILANPRHKYYASYWGHMTRRPANLYQGSAAYGINGSAQQTNSYLFSGGPQGAEASAWGARPGNGGPSNIGYLDQPRTSAVGPKMQAQGINGWHTITAGKETSLPGDGTNAGVTGAFAGGGIHFGPTAMYNGISVDGTKGLGSFANQGSSGLVTGTTDKYIKDSLPSMIFYRFYLEDLTVSKRTYEEVVAIDQQIYTREVMTSGGRYYGDTFTNPSTLP